jgi:hypothetical protein
MAKYRIAALPPDKFPTGGTVSQRWEAVTGTPWADAKTKGFTTGSLDDNLSLLKKLNSGELDVSQDLSTKVSVADPAPTGLRPIDPAIVTNIKSANSFNEAFTIARKALGANHIFEYNGRKYGTNMKGETFNPSTEVLAASGMNTPAVKSRLEKENKSLMSPFLSKSTVKLQPDPYEKWEETKKKNEELNKQSNADKIINYKKKTKDDKNFIIVDKKKGLLHVYDPKGTQLFSSAIDLGALQSDAQTVTKYKDLNKDGKISGNEVNKNNVDWSAGNLSTGAGKFYISNIDPAGYEGLPILNMMNEGQYENYLKTGKVENVSTSFHKGYVKDDKSRVSNGCIRCNKTTLDNLTKYLQNSSEVYILPEDKGNDFVYENGKLNFRVNSGKDYNAYNDQTGKSQKGQGVNRTQNTLNYKPIKLKFDEGKFRNEIFTAMDWDDEEELKRTKIFINALQDEKQKIMKAAKINGDVYNEIAKLTFGIYGTESGYADTHSGVTNLGRAVNKWLDPENSSSPDYESKYSTYGGNKKTNSVGFTQIRWSYLNEDEKKALKQVGITSNKDFMNPGLSAIGTAVVLGVRYNQQLTPEQQKDIWKYLPFKWNTRDNYADRVKNNSKYVSVYQYTGNDKPKTPTKTPVKTNTAYSKTPANVASSTYVKQYVKPVNIPKMDLTKAKPKSNIYKPYDPMYYWNNLYNPMKNSNSKMRPFEDGGFIEIDIPNEQVQEYTKRGYNVEEVDSFSNGGIFRRRRKESPDYSNWSGVNPEIVQPGEDPFALPTYPSGPEAEFGLPDYASMFPGWSEEEIAAYYTEKEAYDARMSRKNSYAPEDLTFKDLARPKGHFVLAEDMSKEFLKELKDNGFYANKTPQGDYEVFSNKDIADLIYTKGITPTELQNEFKLGNAKELKSYFEPVYTNASMIHAKRNTEKINKLVAQGYTKEKAINELVKQGEGTKTGLNNLYGKYTDAAFNKNEAEVEALTSMGIGDPSKLTNYQRQMYLNIKNFSDADYQKNVQSANDQVASWSNWGIQPAESTAIRNNAGYVDPMTGQYMQGDNTTAYEENQSAKANAEYALNKYNATTAMQAQAAKEILGSDQLSDEQRKKFLENPEEFNKILKEYVDYRMAPQGENTQFSLYNDPYVRVYPGREKSDFDVTAEGAQWTPGTYETRRTIDGPVEMVYPEKYLIGPGGGLLGSGFRGMTRALEYAPISAAPWATAGNALNAYMGYETVKPGGLISQSIEGFKEDDKLKGWGNAGMSALNLLPFVGPTVKGLKYLDDLNQVQNAGDFEGVTQAGIGNWFKGTSGGSSLIDDATLASLKANKYQGASDDLLTQIIQKKKGDIQKGTWNSQMTMDEEMILSANKDRVNELVGTVSAPAAAAPNPATGFLGKTYEKGKNVLTGTANKVGTTVSKPAKNWWGTLKSDVSNTPWYEMMSPLRVSNASKASINTTAAKTAVQNTTKYQSMDEISQAMYGSNFDDLSGLAKTQVEKTFKAQPLPSGASTSGQGAASTVTKVSDDILLKNKISQQKYGQDYDQVSSWGQTAIDKEFQAAKTLQQEASASLQAENTAKTAAEDSGTWGDWVSREQNNLLGGLGVGIAAGSDDQNSNAMLAGLPLAFMTRGKVKLSPDKLKYLQLASNVATEVSPLKTSAVLGADASNIKNFIEGSAFNKGLTGTAQQTEGAFNLGVFNVVDDPNFIIKMEHPASIGAARGMPDYQNVNMAEVMQGISGPTFGKVHHQVLSPSSGRKALILNKLDGTPYNELTMDDYLGMSDESLVKFHDDLQTLKRNNLGFDFMGNNYMFNRNKGEFQLFDIDPHTTMFDPDKVGTFDYFQSQVYGGGNPLIYGSKPAGLNLQGAMKTRLGTDLERKLHEAGVSGADATGVSMDYQKRIQDLLRGLNYEKDGGSIEMDIDPDILDQLIASGFNVEQM